MKKILIILIVLTASLKQLNAQTGVPDTLAYLQSIAANKSRYIGQPFSKLMDSLKIQIKYFNQNTAIVYDISKETSTSFGFYFPQTNSDFYLTYPRLEVYWQTYLNATQSWNLYQTYGGGWTSSVIAFYSTGIIADIKVRE